MSGPLDVNDDLQSLRGDSHDKQEVRERKRKKSKVRINSRGTTVTDGEANRDQISRHNSNYLPQLQESRSSMPKGIMSPAAKFSSGFKPNAGLSPMKTSFYNPGESGSLRRLPIVGDGDPTKPGYTSFEWHSKSTDSTSASKRALACLQYWVGGSICACRLTMTDGSRSPKFGKFHPLDRSV